MTRSIVAEGRVKAAPFSPSPHRLEFEVYDAGGKVIYTGSLDHPARQWREAVDQNGKLHGEEHIVNDAPLLLRLPGELRAEKIAFFEVKPSAPSRVPLSALTLPQ